MATIQMRSYEPIAAGTYRFVLLSVKEGEGEKKWGDYLVWELGVISDQQYVGKTIQYRTSMQVSPNSNAFQLIKALGTVDFKDGVTLDTAAFEGKTFWAQASVESSRAGNPLNKLKTFWSDQEWSQMTNIPVESMPFYKDPKWNTPAPGVPMQGYTPTPPPPAAPVPTPPPAPSAPVQQQAPPPPPPVQQQAPAPPPPVQQQAPAPVQQAPAPAQQAPAPAQQAPAPAPAQQAGTEASNNLDFPD